MIVKTKTLDFQTKGGKVTYFDITDDVVAFVKETGVKNGIIAVQSQHTTCAVFFEEMVHDFDLNGDDFLQADLNNVLEKFAPRQMTENGYYRYPGPKHLEFAKEYGLNLEDEGSVM